MTESVKQRLGGSKIGKMNDLELRPLFLAIQSDLAAIGVSLTAVRVDLVKLSNNTGANSNTVQILATSAPSNLNLVV